MDNFDRFLLTVVYDIPHLVFVVDPIDKRIIYANQHMLDLLGADCIGSHFAEKFSSAGGDHFFVSYLHGRTSLAPDAAVAATDETLPLQSEYYNDESEDWFHVLQRPIKWLDGTRKIVFVLNENPAQDGPRTAAHRRQRRSRHFDDRWRAQGGAHEPVL